MPIIRVGYDLQQSVEALAVDRRNNAELGQVGPQGIPKLGALAHQDPPNPMQHHDVLLLCRLHANEAHGRPGHRLADRFRICRVVLAALDVGLHVLRRHQLNLMALRDQLAGPVM